MNRVGHYDNGFLLVKEDEAERAPTGVLYYEPYKDALDLQKKIKKGSFYTVYENQIKNSTIEVSQKFLDFIK